MTDNFDRILDECIDRLNRGDSLEDCLADHAEYAEQLEPLLRVMLQSKETYAFVPSASSKMEARQRFNTALDKIEQRRWEKQPLLARFFARPMVLATVAVAIVILIASYFGLRTIYSPSTPGLDEEVPIISQIIPMPDTQGNFAFLISDDVNAIEDFTSVNITISKIGLLLAGNPDQWIEFEPEIKEVDLTQVKGDKTQQIWRGNIPEGQYNNVFIYIADVRGVLKETGKEVEVKLPSQKLHVSKSFQINTADFTSFTFDVTVIEAGKNDQYILQPQISESGADIEPRQDNDKVQGKDKGEGKKQ